MNSVADYENAFTAPTNPNFVNFTGYDRNRIVQPKQSEGPPLNISDEIKNVQNIKEKFSNKKEQVKFLANQIENEEKMRNGFEDSIKKLRDALTDIRTRFSNTSIEHFDEIQAQRKKEDDLLYFYERQHIKFLEESDKTLGKLRSEKAEVDADLSVLYDFMLTSAKDIIPEDKRQSHTCPICIEKQIDTCVVPCGHTFCDGCISKAVLCPLCRKSSTNRVKMFISM